MKPMMHFKSVCKFFNIIIPRTFLIKGVFWCELKQFILAASTLWAIFNVRVSKRRGDINK